MKLVFTIVCCALILCLFSSCHNSLGPTEIEYHNKILFTSSRSGIPQLYMMNPDGSGVRQITSGPYWHDWGRWSPDAKEIAAITGENTNTASSSNIVLMNADGTNRRLLRYGYGIAWSPDGKKIAFVAMPQAELGDLSTYIYVLNLLDSSVTQVTHDVYTDVGTLCWSPDGNAIYFASNLRNRAKLYSEIYRIGSDGTDLKQITATANGYNSSPCFSPDGNVIAFRYMEDSLAVPTIALMDPDGTNLRKVIESPAGMIFNLPRFSPDGKRLTFVAASTDGWGRTFVCTVDTSGANLRYITPSDATAKIPDWSR